MSPKAMKILSEVLTYFACTVGFIGAWTLNVWTMLIAIVLGIVAIIMDVKVKDAIKEDNGDCNDSSSDSNNLS